MSLKKEFTNIIAYCWNWLDWWLICHHNNHGHHKAWAWV